VRIVSKEMDAPLPVTLGTELGGRYRVDRLLGRGGFGAVYQATQLDLGRQVAVKVLFEQGHDQDTLARFEREAKATGSLGHPHIVQVTDFQPQHPPFLVMEFLAGEPLHALLQRQPRLPPTRAARIAMQVLSALGAAHSIGIVHRDIKPANLMLVATATGDDFVKVVDFGIAKDLAATGAAVTQSGAVMGTVGYMAPEQALGLVVDVRSDIYAMGGVLYRMLVGTSPYEAANVGQLMQMMAAGVVVAIEQRDPSLPPSLAAVVGRALAHDPEARFPSAGAFSAALAAAMGLRPSWAPPSMTPPSGLVSLLGTTVADERNPWSRQTSIDASASTRTSAAPSPAAMPSPGPAASGSPAPAIQAPLPPPINGQYPPAPARTAGSSAVTKAVLTFGGLTAAALLATGGVLLALRLAQHAAATDASRPGPSSPAPNNSAAAGTSSTGITDAAMGAAPSASATDAAASTTSDPDSHRAPPPRSTAPSASLGGSSRAPMPSAGMPDPAGTCQCNAANGDAICSTKVDKARCECRTKNGGQICSSFASGGNMKICQAMVNMNAPAGAACQGMNAAGYPDVGEWQCSYCDKSVTYKYSGVRGATCSGVARRTGLPSAGTLSCK
jgi:eukaryotic-like serine/threonine-protein kinase